MLGKDYMLAIIIVNYDDNIWNDQNLEADRDLPPGWRTIRDATGTYYWHIPTGATQWQHPAYSAEEDPEATNDITSCNRKSQGVAGRRESRERPMESPGASVNNERGPQAWRDYYLRSNPDPESKRFAVRSLGWVEIPEEDLTPGKSSIAVNNCIQQVSQGKTEDRDDAGAWGEGQDMVMVLKKDTLSLVDPHDHRLIHCQPIANIRVWGVGCNNGRDRDFAFVAGDKDACALKCHVFRCDVPARAIASALHAACSKIMAEKAVKPSSVPRSLTMETISPEDLPLQVDFLDSVRQRVQRFQVEYVGHLPVPRAMGMEVLNRAIGSIMDTTRREEWESTVIHVSDTVLSVWREEDEEDPIWECQAMTVTLAIHQRWRDRQCTTRLTGRQRTRQLQWRTETHQQRLTRKEQVQYQKCLVSQTPPPRSKVWRAGSKVKRANSVDSSSFPTSHHGHLSPKPGTSGVKKGMLAFFETFRNKQSVVPMP
ncbi:amyloid-beta A4 precursor protein-binding family B member 3-like isoform X2 [Anguilla anguilla]|uniref:amyloid-beta A4 precursor protein-binding family B member 3-like isoform X2 n=1 Tax=Anguilla anguilla TaxID=7936 RepID=UPI0015AAE5A9|nr:amyloid-beta A4 precursor protein-binding family B member 3-like isoform X2 [Anguilla anguilla]